MITVDREGGLVVITLNRPNKANALTVQMLDDLIAATKVAQDAHALILTGAGKVFSAGADLDAARAGLATSDVWDVLSGAIAQLPCLTIAALNGTLAGGAFGMALACDMRIAVPTAKFFYPVMKLGYLPQPSDPARLAALTGPSAAKRILLGGQTIDAPEALRLGLVDELVEPDALLDRSKSICGDALNADITHIHAMKRMMRL